MTGFVPPRYPYDRLDELAAVAAELPGGCVDLSIGTPCDPPPAAVVAALAASNAERGYPASIGTLAFREAAARWLERRLGVTVDPVAEVAACVGTKEFVAGVPHWLRLRTPERDTVLYPAMSYPTYEMGATLAGCRAVAYTTLDEISDADAERALLLWVNTPANPSGELVDLDLAARWGRARRIPVVSDECYIEFTWQGPPHTILEHGTDGVIAVHSLSKRSNLAGARVGFFAGDPNLVGYLRDLRRHAGFMVAGPIQAAAIVAFDDDVHVDEQRALYLHRLRRLRDILNDGLGLDVALPQGAFYLWVPAPGGDAWALAKRFAHDAGMLGSPGEFYGPAAADHVRLAVVQPDERIELIARRLNV